MKGVKTNMGVTGRTDFSANGSTSRHKRRAMHMEKVRGEWGHCTLPFGVIMSTTQRQDIQVYKSGKKGLRTNTTPMLWSTMNLCGKLLNTNMITRQRCIVYTSMKRS
jgi:hypothetical protein